MALALRRPFAVAHALKQLSSAPRPASLARYLHQQAPRRAPLPKFSPLSDGSRFASAHKAFQKTFKRSQGQMVYNPTGSGSFQKRLLYGGAIFGGTLVAINLMFNRETREDGGMPLFERKYLNDTFMHTGLGLGIIAIAANALHANGWSYRLMSANPWLVMGVGLVGSIGTMIACRSTHPDNYVTKYALWTGFNVTQAALLSPMLFFAPSILARAGLYTIGMMGSLAFVGATAKQEKYLYLGGPLLAGVAIVALSGLAPMVLPATAVRTLVWSDNIWLYGGLAVFGGFTLYDVQKVLHHARLAETGAMVKDPVNESISLELDFINIFVRMVQILAMRQNGRR